MWNEIIGLGLRLPVGETPLSRYPNVLRWHEKMKARDGVKKTLAIRQEMMDEEGLGENAMPKDRKIEDMVKQLDKAHGQT